MTYSVEFFDILDINIEFQDQVRRLANKSHILLLENSVSNKNIFEHELKTLQENMSNLVSYLIKENFNKEWVNNAIVEFTAIFKSLVTAYSEENLFLLCDIVMMKVNSSISKLLLEINMRRSK